VGTKSTTETTTQAAGSQENAIMRLLMQMANKASGEMGNLGELAKGNVGGPTQSDLELIQQSIGRSGDMARRELERALGPMMAQMNETNTARGIKGSSMEMLNQILGGRDLQGLIADMMTQSQQQGGEALMNLPFKRGEMQLGANQTLFNMLTGASNPVLQSLLTSRMSNTKTTTKTPPNPMEIMQMAIKLGAAIPTGGASLAMPGGGGGGSGGGMPPMPNPYTGRY